MIHPILAAAFAAMLICSTVACSLAEADRKVNFYSPAEEAQMGSDAYKDVLGKEKRCTDAEANALVARVGKRLAAVVKTDQQFAWEFNLLESSEVNAFCLPGGKVAVYTAILPYCENEAALAAVMGHEIGHAVARHGGRRMTQGVIMSGLETTLGEVLKAKGVSETSANLSLAAFGGLSQVGVMLPFSRTHELEADAMGLEYMAQAGYDPQEAVRFWQRFAKLGSSGPAFLSTHPQSAERAEKLAALMPKAVAEYQAAPAKSGIGAQVPARYRTVPAPAPAK